MRRLTARNGRLYLQCDYADRDIVKAIPGRAWHPRNKCWTFPLGAQADIARAFPDVVVDESVHRASEEEHALDRVVEQARTMTEPVVPMPLRVKPYAHQACGFNIAYTLLTAKGPDE